MESASQTVSSEQKLTTDQTNADVATKPVVDMTFTKELRKATKDVHKISDVLVNAKFALALSDDAVWFDGLLAFYEVYRFLEENLPENLLPKELHRKSAFEQDLAYYLGKNWKDNYEPRESVKKYIDHLEEVNAKNKLLLFAYAYQMYMALMSGGQLLQKKRMIKRKLWFGKQAEEEEEEVKLPNSNPEVDDLENRPMPSQVTICPEGCAATYFPEKISVLKDKLRQVLNDNYGNFNDDLRAEFIEESRNVFIYNGDVVRSIKGVNRANLRKLAMVLVFVMGVYFALKLAKR
ncbi:heme oxygenase 1 [Bactrocera dorsalis]|uniref:Heme oxygenase n=2 Tax=Endopterygota TaxID=33392 RepID=A0A034WS11_BACDO|nr:heme oxygenase 1 [Bactrocera dorsalis]ANS71632.1 heme oxygenase-like protein [Bactrocera dorsalis]